MHNSYMLFQFSKKQLLKAALAQGGFSIFTASVF